MNMWMSRMTAVSWVSHGISMPRWRLPHGGWNLAYYHKHKLKIFITLKNRCYQLIPVTIIRTYLLNYPMLDHNWLRRCCHRACFPSTEAEKEVVQRGRSKVISEISFNDSSKYLQFSVWKPSQCITNTFNRQIFCQLSRLRQFKKLTFIFSGKYTCALSHVLVADVATSVFFLPWS